MTIDLLHFIFFCQEYLNWWTPDILKCFLCDANFNSKSFQKAIIFKVFTPASSSTAERQLQCHGSHLDCFKDYFLWRPSSAVSVGECRQSSGQLSPVSTVDARFVYFSTSCVFLLMFIQAQENKQCAKYSQWKQDGGFDLLENLRTADM